MSAIQQQVEKASGHYSSSFTKGHLALPPAKKYLVLTCMDARIDPVQAFGIDLGDAHVIRNVRALSLPNDASCVSHGVPTGLTSPFVVFDIGRCFCPGRAPQHHHLGAAARHAGDCAGQAHGLRHADVQER